MNTDLHLSKIRLLLEQSRYPEAEKMILDLLLEDSGDVDLLALLCEARLHQNKLEEAEETIDSAIALSPDYDYLFYTKARISLEKERYDEAESLLQHAIALDPLDANYFAFLAHIKSFRKEYAEALRLANKALELDSENLLALNTRSTAQLKLGNKEAAFETIQGALREDPNNAYTHANYGWGLLEKGEVKKAMEHFKEALQNEPDQAYAQAGLQEALKARNPLYRLFLKYSFFIGNLSAKYQWGVIIGFYLLTRFINNISHTNETLAQYLSPLVIILALVAFSTWIMNPLGNLFLRLNRYGNILLDKEEKISSTLVGISLLASICGFVLYGLLGAEGHLSLGIWGFSMMLPLGIMFAQTNPKNILIWFTAALGVIGLWAVSMAYKTGIVYSGLATIYLIGLFAFQWVANFFMIKSDNR